jgi:branched-chain amino acid transport system substrate-binding protein
LRNNRTPARLACAFAVAVAAAGCGASSGPGGGSDPAPAATAAARTLTIYIDLATSGPPAVAQSTAQQLSIENGARLALEQWHHRVSYGPHARRGTYTIKLRPLNDADPATGGYSQGLTAANAAAAASDPTTVAYIGDYDSAATAISLPVLSQDAILQVSPWSPYIGFTDSNPADGTGDPARYYPSSGQTTFARIAPSDLVEAQATVSFMRYEGVTRLYVLGDVSVFDAAIAQLVANDAPSAGITVVGLQQGIDTQTNTQPRGYAQIAAPVVAQRADAVLLGAAPGVGAAALWRELHAAAPHVKLFAPSTLATPTFLAAISKATGGCATVGGAPQRCGSAAGVTYVTSPILQPRQYPRAARRIMRAYRRRFHEAATVYALYGYAAMEDVLAAIRRTGRQVAKRAALLGVFFHHLGVRRGVLGSYTINGNGDSSLDTFDGYRVSAGGDLVAVREFRLG